MATVKITVATKPVELHPGEEAGVLKLTMDGSDGSHMDTEMTSNEITFRDVMVGEYTVTVQRMDQNGIGLGDPVVETFKVTLAEVRTYDAPTGLSITVTK